MLTRLLSFNLFEVRLKFNSCPSPNAGRCVCSPAVGRWVVSSWAQVFSLCLGLTLFMPEGHRELQTTEFFIKVTSWRDVPCSCCFLSRCAPSSYITYPALTCSSLSGRSCLTLVQIGEHVLWSQHEFVVKLGILRVGLHGLIMRYLPARAFLSSLLNNVVADIRTLEGLINY